MVLFIGGVVILIDTGRGDNLASRRQCAHDRRCLEQSDRREP
jgi:hypothetical protein